MTRFKRVPFVLLSVALLSGCMDRELPTSPLAPAASVNDATCVVQSLADDGGLTTLRSLIENPDCAVIDFGVTGSITLDTGRDHLFIARDLAINGPGAHLLTVRQDRPESRVFWIHMGTVQISGITISGGGAGEGGGGIQNLGALTLNYSTVSGNIAAFGGGIFTLGPLTLNHSTVTGNNASDFGGGIYTHLAPVTLNHSTVSDNTAHVAGGIYNSNSRLTLSHSTVAGNTGWYGPGGILGLYDGFSPPETYILNSTISGNHGGESTGGIDHGSGVLRIVSSTVTGNDGWEGAGGVASSVNVTQVERSIIWGNTLVGSFPSDLQGSSVESLGYNLIGDTGGSAFNAPGDITGVPAGSWLGPLADNGGPTLTHALLPGSPAIDAGSCTDDAGVTIATDQRGVSRPAGGACDIGAFEAASASAPLAPAALSDTSISVTAIQLGWTDNSGDETHFQIGRRVLDANGVWSALALHASPARNATSYTDTGLNPGTRYVYRIRSCRDLVCSSWSSPQRGTTQALAAPVDLAAVATSTTQVDIAWSYSGSDASEFQIERRVRGTDGTWSGFLLLTSPPGNSTSYSNIGLDAGTAYLYRIRACATAGSGCSAWSAQARVITLRPAAPSTLGGVAVSNSQVDLTWTDNSDDETGFQLERQVRGADGAWSPFTPLAPLAANADSHSDLPLSAGTDFGYRIRACLGAACSRWSNVIAVTTARSAAPANLAANALGSTRIEVTWSDTSAETAYQVQRQVRAPDRTWSAFSVVSRPAANATSFTNEGLSPGTSYRYRIRACYGAVCSVWSSVVPATTPLPAAPNLLTESALSDRTPRAPGR